MSYRSLLRDETFQDFLEEIRGKLQEKTMLTRTESDTVRLFRAQGAVEVLEALLAHPEEQVLFEQQEADAAAEAVREEADE